MLSIRAGSMVVALALGACVAPNVSSNGCVRDAQCAAGLVCALGRCRAACRTSRDCGPEERCLVEPATGLAACSIVEADDCVTHGCPDGLACRSGECVNLCGSIVACPDGVCEGDVCTPMRLDAGVPLDASIPLDAGNACHGPGCDPVAHVSVGEAHVLAVTASGAVWGWGESTFGLLGDRIDAHGTCADCAPTPVQALDPSGAPWTDVVEVGAGHAYSCVRRADGSVWCWGHDYTGELGDGTSHESLVPVRVLRAEGASTVPIDDATWLTVANNSSCVLRGTPSEAWCWGSGDDGRLGTGNTDASPFAVRATELGTDLVAIEINEGTLRALAADGTVRSVGLDRCHALTTGTPGVDVLTAVTAPVTGAISLAGSIWNTCVVDAAGTLQCWGMAGPLLGDIATYPTCEATCPLTCSGAPVTVLHPAAHPFTRIFGRSDGVFFGVDASHALYVWGGAYHTPYNDIRYPQPVAPGVRVVEAFSGTAACLVTVEGDVLCLGANDHGQLGRGSVSTALVTTPSSVVWP